MFPMFFAQMRTLCAALVSAEGVIDAAYNSVQDGRPTLVLVLLHCLKEHFLVLGNGHLLVDKQLVASLVVRLEWEALGELGIHGVDINVHYSVLGDISDR